MAENQNKLKEDELEQVSGGAGDSTHRFAKGDYVVYKGLNGNTHCYHIHELISNGYYQVTHCTLYPNGGKDYTGMIKKNGTSFPSDCTVFNVVPDWCTDIDNFINFW